MIYNKNKCTDSKRFLGEGIISEYNERSLMVKTLENMRKFLFFCIVCVVAIVWIKKFLEKQSLGIIQNIIISFIYVILWTLLILNIFKKAARIDIFK